MTLTREQLTRFLDEKLGVDRQDLEGDTPLFSSGLLDSFSMVELIMFIEAETGIRFNGNDATLDNLNTMNSILSFANPD